MTAKFASAAPTQGVLKLSGPDRATFLQGLVSNDVLTVTPTHGIWTAFLTPQGKYLHDFMLTETGDAILIEVEQARMEDLRIRLLRFKLRSKIALDDVSAEFEVWQVWGNDAFGLPDPGDATVMEAGTILRDPRLGGLGLRAILATGTGPAFFREKGCGVGSIADWHILRIQSGVPDGMRDLIPEKSLLLENGFEELNGVSFTKGCFMGQELTARTKYRALIKKRLLPVVAHSGDVPPEGAIITDADGKDVGEMRSGQGDHGLAVLRLEALDAGNVFTVGNTKVTATVPDWVNLKRERP